MIVAICLKETRDSSFSDQLTTYYVVLYNQQKYKTILFSPTKTPILHAFRKIGVTFGPGHVSLSDRPPIGPYLGSGYAHILESGLLLAFQKHNSEALQ